MKHCGEQEVLINVVNATIRLFPRKHFHLYLQQLQLYYYMQKVASGNMGNPKKSMECPICNKVLYDRSTWNRHMRIHTGKKKFGRNPKSDRDWKDRKKIEIRSKKDRNVCKCL